MRFFKKKRNDGFLESVECGQFTLDFYYDEKNAENCKIDIRCGAVMDLTVKPAHDAYSFLLVCYNDKDKDSMEAYCGLLWECSHLLVMDETFPSAVVKSWSKYIKKLEKQAEAEARAVTEEQNEADEVLMQEAAKLAQLSDAEKAKYAESVVEKLDKAAVKIDADEANEAAAAAAAKPKSRRKKK